MMRDTGVQQKLYVAKPFLAKFLVLSGNQFLMKLHRHETHVKSLGHSDLMQHNKGTVPMIL